VIGIGEHSGKNIQKVVMDAQFKAYRNLVPIPRYRSVQGQQQQQQQQQCAYCRGGWV
jgi:hypothetical protein